MTIPPRYQNPAQPIPRPCENPLHGLGCQCAASREKEKREKEAKEKAITDEGKKLKKLEKRLKEIEKEIARRKNMEKSRKKGGGDK